MVVFTLLFDSALLVYAVHIISGDCAYVPVTALRHMQKNESEFQSEICSTEICSSESQKMLDNLDETVDPCTDFYEFACGKFRHDTVIPMSREKVTKFTMIKDQITEQMRLLLSEPLNSTEPDAIHLLKTFDRSCTDATNLNENGILHF